MSVCEKLESAIDNTIVEKKLGGGGGGGGGGEGMLSCGDEVNSCILQ